MFLKSFHTGKLSACIIALAALIFFLDQSTLATAQSNVNIKDIQKQAKIGPTP
jgi:hypothetical protein